MSGHRLPAGYGAFIDRGRPVGFSFNGRPLKGLHGDTLAAALLANGVALTARSFKLHRPRGIWSCGLEEPSALVDVGDGARHTPNVRATRLPLSEGLAVRSVNCWPSVGFDLGALAGACAALLPAGFYYKSFMWPSWRLFEPAIRRMAGLGRAPLENDADHYEERSTRTEVLVVGGGLTGLAAACAAAEAGAATLLLCASARCGGALAWRNDPQIDALTARAQRLGVRLLMQTLAFGLYDHKLVCALETVHGDAAGAAGAGVLRERLWKIRAREVIAAAGAFERPLVFPGNDRPGVMLAGAALKYAHAYGVACGRRAVIAAGCDSAYTIARELRGAGMEIAAVLERRAAAPAAAADLPVRLETEVTQVAGARAVRGCRVRAKGRAGEERIACDLLLSIGGMAPAVHLHSQAGGRLRWLPAESMFVPDAPAAAGVSSVGACAGTFGREAAQAHAAAVGRALARGEPPPAAPLVGAGTAAPIRTVSGARGKQFVDLQNDVTVDDVALAARENYRSVEHFKRYTTTGMGTDQGKTSNINALVLLGVHTGREPQGVGTTRFRPPFAPVTLGAIAARRVGALYRPLKDLPAYDWHATHGALLENFGDWRRPACYPQPGESLEDAALREAAAVRRGAGLFDGSPLGKLEVFGPDAARFLDLMYVGTMSTLAVGQARYGVLLNELGTLVDDGIVARLGEQHFWVNTTTAGAERTAAAFEEWLQCEYLDFRVLITPVTSQWGNVTVAGPRAWQWLSAAGLDATFEPQRMKHMTIAASTWQGMPLRVLRASFSGELGYEVNLPATHAAALFERLWQERAAVGGVLYGIEALQVLRVEKGYLHIGTDTDGTTLPQDVGLARGIERKAANFVGRRSLSQPVGLDPQRLQLVGLKPVDGVSPLHVGAHIGPHAPPGPIEGRVTSACFSPQLKCPIALALVARGFERRGERIAVYHQGAMTQAEVVATPFVDPEGRRLRG